MLSKFIYDILIKTAMCFFFESELFRIEKYNKTIYSQD